MLYCLRHASQISISIFRAFLVMVRFLPLLTDKRKEEKDTLTHGLLNNVFGWQNVFKQGENPFNSMGSNTLLKVPEKIFPGIIDNDIKKYHWKYQLSIIENITKRYYAPISGNQEISLKISQNNILWEAMKLSMMNNWKYHKRILCSMCGNLWGSTRLVLVERENNNKLAHMIWSMIYQHVHNYLMHNISSIYICIHNNFLRNLFTHY